MKSALLLLLLLVAVVATGIRIAHTGYEVRMLHAAMEEQRKAQDAALVEHAQLQLERGAVASFAETERTARQKLAMRYPEALVEVLP